MAKYELYHNFIKVSPTRWSCTVLHTHLDQGWIPLSLRRWFIFTVSHNNESKNTYTTSNPVPLFSKSQQHLLNLLLQKRPCPLRGLLSTILVVLLSISQSFKLSWLSAENYYHFFQHQIQKRLAAFSSLQIQLHINLVSFPDPLAIKSEAENLSNINPWWIAHRVCGGIGIKSVLLKFSTCFVLRLTSYESTYMPSVKLLCLIRWPCEHIWYL